MPLKELDGHTPNGGSRPRSEFEIGAIERELQRVLQSAAFRNSKQCQKFLHYVVEQSRSARDSLLRERIIGVELFGRASDYDTSTDPIVRVRANEVRKRLGQCYQEGGVPGPVRFEMPPGSYMVEFHWARAAAAPLPAPDDARRDLKAKWLLGLLAAFGLAAVAVFLYSGRFSHTSALEQFWAPAVNSPKEVVICSGHPVVYFISQRIHTEYRLKRNIDPQGGPYVIELDPEDRVAGRDIVPVTDQFVSVGDAGTSARLLALFAGLKKPAELRFGNDISFSDLRMAPSVLIGAYSNQWTLKMTEDLRFVFQQDGSVKGIVDRSAPNRSWALKNIAPDGKTNEDYAIISRLFDSKTGQFLVAVAGITQYGTRAGGEFLTDNARLQQAISTGPRDWAQRGMQVVIHTDVIRGVAGPPKIVATHFW